MGRRETRQKFWTRFFSAIRTNSYNPDDAAVIHAVVAAAMMAGGVIGWLAIEAITRWNAAALSCADICLMVAQ